MINKELSFELNSQTDVITHMLEELDLSSADKLISDLKEYMEGPLIDQDDLSYQYINNEESVKFISKAIAADIKSILNEVKRRDLVCEYKVL